MTIRRTEIVNSDDTIQLTFSLPDDGRGGEVSIVGSFNDWAPGANPFVAAGDGTRSVTVVVPVGPDIYFRYLGSDGYWFDDADADAHTSDGGVVATHLSHHEGEVEAVDATATHHSVADALAMGPLPGSVSEDAALPENPRSA